MLVGVVVGVLSGMLGIGGGTIMVPMFRLGFGLSAIQATATSLFTIIPTSLAGCIVHIRQHSCVIPLGLAAGCAGACLSPLGVWFARMSPSWAIMAAAAVVIAYSAFTMLRKGLAMPRKNVSDSSGACCDAKSSDAAHKGDSTCDDTKVSASTMQSAAGSTAVGPTAIDSTATGSTTDESCISASPLSKTADDRPALKTMIVKGALIGLIAGLASGYVGVGGGFLMVPLFLSFVGISMHQASGTSLIAVTILAIPGTIEQIIFGNVVIAEGCALAIGSIPGALIGAAIVKYVPERMLKLVFGGVLLVTAVFLIVNEFL